MSYNKTFPILISCVFSSGLLAANAGTIESTTTKTTTVQPVGAASGPVETVAPVQTIAFVLPTEARYLVVDGRSGVVVGSYDTATKSLEGGRALPVGALIVEKSSGHLVATVDATGRVVDVYTAPATETLASAIHERRTQLTQLITDARAAGAISNEQAAAMRAELDRIVAETTISPSTLTYGQAMLLGYNLDLLSDRLVPIVHTAQPIAPIVPAEFVVVGGELAMVDNSTYRRVVLEKRIDDEYKAGRLSSHDVSELKSQLDQIAALESKYRGSDGQLSGSKQKKLAMRLNEVQSSLDNDVTHVNKRRSQIGLIVD